MTNRNRNLSILGIVLILLAGAVFTIATKETRLGLDLKGGIELVYQGQPTPQVPVVTPQALDDAVSTIRKRTDALGVSEPEIQRSGRDQISIGLPSVQNAERAIAQVGSTAQLQFYDWEPNVLGRGPDVPFAGSKALYDAAEFAGKQKPKAEKVDVPPGSDLSPAKADEQNDTSATDRYYLFGPDRYPIGNDGKPLREGDYEPSANCKALLGDYEPAGGTPNKYAKDTECSSQLDALGSAGPPSGSRVIKVPRGIVVVEGEAAPNQSARVHRFFVIEDDSELNGKEIKNPEQAFDPNTNAPLVNMEFTTQGREAFARVTKRIAERGRDCETLAGVDPKCPPQGSQPDQFFQRFAITLDNKIVSLATIDYQENPDGIDGRTGASIQNIGDIGAAQDLAENLRIGALPIDLKLISQTQVSATLGQQALNQGLTAAAAGLALTILFLLLFYRALGAVATVALLIYAGLLFALVKLIPITLTLPGIAGMVLTLAVAADANIVMYERIKEEVRGGRSVPAAISAGYSKALRTIIDANVVTIGVAFILFTLATAGVKGFAFTLGIGTLVSLFTAVLATSAILGSLARTRLLRRPSALGTHTSAKREGWRFDFMGNSRWFFSLSGAILAAGAIAIAALGINFGIDFESGTRITAPLQHAASVDKVRSTLQPLGYGDAAIQTVNDPELGENVVQIEVHQLDPNQVTKVENTLDDAFGVAKADFVANSVGPTFGKQIAQTALYAVIASLLLISLYIGFRFEWKFAVPVLIALAHDLLITAGTYAIFDREVTTATVAALLTILGYSLYDTVIVFDRIRENVPRMPRATFSQIANRSMSEVFTRSLATSFVVLMPVGSLLLFGGETLKDFAFALLVGVLSGAYSSIFIATPVLVEWKERERTYMRRRRMMLQEFGGHIPAFATGSLGEPTPAPAGAAAAAGAASAAPVPTDRAARRQRRAGISSSTATRTAPRPATPPPPADGDGAPPARAADPAPPSPPPERAAEPSADTPASPSAPAAPSDPPADAAKQRSKRQQKRRKHGRR
ncbi:MAG TPA: protein translocase subunit SecD [Thermoleophilaceae bacterium]|nr:protein translocase subunit SecD [Thermoleophilaceae bacterium]